MLRRRRRRPPRRWEAPQAQPRMATVTALSEEDGRPVAIVQGPDGVEYPVYPQGGWLPAVGDTVTLVANGADPIASVARRLVEGDVRSGEASPDREWGMDSTGFLWARGAEFEGSVTAREFRTRADFESEGGVQIDSEHYNRLLLRRPGPLEDEPASITAEHDSGQSSLVITAASHPDQAQTPRLRLYTDDDHSSASLVSGTIMTLGSAGQTQISGRPLHLFTVEDRISLDAADGVMIDAGTGEILLIGDTTVAGKIDLDVPLYVARSTSAQSLGNATWAALTPNSTIAARKVVASGSQIRPQEEGYYEINVALAWAATAGSFVGGAAVSRNGSSTPGADFIQGSFGSQNTGFVGVGSTATGVFFCNGTTDYLQARGFSAGTTSATLTQVSVKRLRPAF